MTFQTASPARARREAQWQAERHLDAGRVDAWLRELRLVPVERDEREGSTSWDLVLDGLRRFDVRVTLILEPSLGMVAWVHYAPALNDSFRKSYRQFLRWNDELPFAKFALSADERPVLTSELAPEELDVDRLGLALARLLAICDLLLEESRQWLWAPGRRPDESGRTCRNPWLFERYRDELAELSPAQ